jgi:uracil-DNA glycosylase
MRSSIPQTILEGIALANPAWHDCLHTGLKAVMSASPGYLQSLAQDAYLPTDSRLFAAFSQPLDAVRFVLVGEGPYPRAHSATGFCFMDGAVGNLWSESGLSKQVNRATSLRNFMKMLLVADGQLLPAETTGESVRRISQQVIAPESSMIRALGDLQDNLHRNGFLLLNATPVFRPDVPPAKESRAWQPFLQAVLDTLADHAEQFQKPLPKLVLWGKIAERLLTMPGLERFPQLVSEHPYNLSFISHSGMLNLFGPMRLLQKNTV